MDTATENTGRDIPRVYRIVIKEKLYENYGTGNH